MKTLAIERSIPYLEGVAERYAHVLYFDNATVRPQDIAHADALIVRSITQCNEALLGGSNVRFIATATAGYDHIDQEYCLRMGISWASAPGCNAKAVAQWLLSALARQSLDDRRALSEHTIGIIGVGHVGRQIERVARALGMRVYLYDPPRADEEGMAGFSTMAELQTACDIITLHVPLVRSGAYPTYHLVDSRWLEQCQPGLTLINACRGRVTDTSALIHAHRSGQISSLMLDCWEGEPHIDHELLALADLATPHIAGFSADGKHRGARMALRAVLDHWGIIPTDDLLDTSELPPPATATIDLDRWEPSEQVARAILSTLDLSPTMQALRATPETFEAMRRGYAYPREFDAYSVVGGGASERATLSTLGFTLG